MGSRVWTPHTAHRLPGPPCLLQIYCWQGINCLELWARVLGAHSERPELRPLVHPTTQLIIGAARLVPTPRYFPLRLRLVRTLNRCGGGGGGVILAWGGGGRGGANIFAGLGHRAGHRVHGLGHRVRGLGHRGHGLGHRARGLGHRARGLGHRGRGLGHRGLGLGHRARGLGHRARGLGHRACGLGHSEW